MSGQEMKHTPGPWCVGHNNIRIEVAGREGFGGRPYRVADAYFSTAGLANTPSVEAAQSNARLIAAAPELLAALKAIITADDNADFGNLTDTDGGSPGECCPYGSDALRSALEAARAAISKATSV